MGPASARSTPATLGPDDSTHSFRRWTATIPATTGPVGSRCTNVNGVTQPLEATWNPSGYARNVVETIALVTT